MQIPPTTALLNLLAALPAQSGSIAAVPYDVSVHIPTDGSSIDDRCTGESIRAGQVKVMGEHTVGGELASTQENLNRWAVDNGVKINRKTMQSWLREIVRGNSTFDEYKQYITKMAVAQHPNWGKELKAGMSVAEIAEPYRNMAAQMLEMSPKDIDLNNKLLKQALSYKREDGKYDSMTMYDFEDKLRQDPRWMKTDNAKEQFMETGSAVLRMFGLST